MFKWRLMNTTRDLGNHVYMNIYLMIVDLNYKDKKQCTHRSVDVQKRPKEGGGYFKCVQRRCLE